MFLIAVSYFVFWAQTHKSFSFYAIFENYHCGYAENLEAFSCSRVLINIKFAN